MSQLSLKTLLAKQYELWTRNHDSVSVVIKTIECNLQLTAGSTNVQIDARLLAASSAVRQNMSTSRSGRLALEEFLF